MLKPEQVDALVKDDRIHVSVYSDDAIYREELKRIFYTTWVYLGHVSEIAKPGDYKSTYIGLLPVIVSRDKDDRLRVFFNLSTANSDSPLLLRESGHEDFIADFETAQKGFGLIEVARIDSYRGLIFGSMSPTGDRLEDHLGLAKDYLDELMDRSPNSEIDVSGGIWKHVYRGNWKLQLEGSNEGYHADFLHRVVRLAGQRSRSVQRRFGGNFTSGKGRGVDLGNGHSIMEFPIADEAVWRSQFPEEYVKRIEDLRGVERTKILLGRPWRLVIFPNMAVSDNHIRVMRPISVSESEVRQYHFKRVGVSDEMIATSIFGHQVFYGPAGFGSPDDLEVFARMDEGYRAGTVHEKAQWALFNRGYTGETLGPSGERIAHTSSEVETRANYYAWRALMKGESSVTIPNRRTVAQKG